MTVLANSLLQMTWNERHLLLSLAKPLVEVLADLVLVDVDATFESFIELHVAVELHVLLSFLELPVDT